MRVHELGDAHEQAKFVCEERGWWWVWRLLNAVYTAHLASLRAFLRAVR